MPIALPLSRSPARCFSLKAPSFTRFRHNNHSVPVNSSLKSENGKPLDGLRGTHKLCGFLQRSSSGFSSDSRYGFCAFAAEERNGGGVSEESIAADEEIEARGLSSMPERFRYLTKEAPEKSVRWPWLIVLAVMLYSWRAVVWELFNWKRTAGAVFRFLGYILKLVLAAVFHFIGDPVISLIRGFETILYTVRAFYSSVIAYAPIQELTTIIVLTSAVLAIAEATVPDSVNSQPYLLSLAGMIGFAAVKNYISELFFWTLLACLFAFARLVRKRDAVSSALPLAAVLAAVGEPWVRTIAIASYLALAISHHSKIKNGMEAKEVEDSGAIKRIPIPLACAALAIGVRVMAKWAGYRHLTWMVA